MKVESVYRAIIEWSGFALHREDMTWRMVWRERVGKSQDYRQGVQNENQKLLYISGFPGFRVLSIRHTINQSPLSP